MFSSKPHKICVCVRMQDLEHIFLFVLKNCVNSDFLFPQSDFRINNDFVFNFPKILSQRPGSFVYFPIFVIHNPLPAGDSNRGPHVYRIRDMIRQNPTLYRLSHTGPLNFRSFLNIINQICFVKFYFNLNKYLKNLNN